MAEKEEGEQSEKPQVIHNGGADEGNHLVAKAVSKNIVSDENADVQKSGTPDTSVKGIEYGGTIVSHLSPRSCLFVCPGFAGYEVPLVIPRPGFNPGVLSHYRHYGLQVHSCECGSTDCGACLTGQLSRIRYQVEYYFGDKNFIRDRYLQEQVTTDRYVPISTILDFPRMKQLGASADLVIQACCTSSVVELDVTKGLIRRRNPMVLQNSLSTNRVASYPTPILSTAVPVHLPFASNIPSYNAPERPALVDLNGSSNSYPTCIANVLPTTSVADTNGKIETDWRTVERRQRSTRARAVGASPQHSGSHSLVRPVSYCSWS
ncbi:unnamed protein product [Calicophoron daubneyi]|uniref:HTH La-type RNA-binding domain-containing protein n=1 Tax=Calicophoron daubneyi TaxID=300641 RepID=A0AAV2U053_CALDB